MNINPTDPGASERDCRPHAAREIVMGEGDIDFAREKNRVYESMTRIPFHFGPFGFVARVWRAEENAGPYSNSDLPRAIVRYSDEEFMGRNKLEMEGIYRYLEACGRVTAIEILDEDGNGGIVYPDWH